MTSLVASHLVNGVVNGVKVLSLSKLSDAELILASSCFSVHSLLKVSLSVPHHFTEQLGKLSGMLSLFPSVALKRLGDFGISFAVGLTTHCKVHTHLTALAIEVVFQTLKDFGVYSLSHSKLMLCYKLQAFVLFKFFKLLSRDFTLRTPFGRCISLVYVTAHCAYPFFCHNLNLF